MGLSGRLWPVHLKPKDDELLSSWLVRLAWAHALKIQTFCALEFGRGKQIWNRDIDRLADREVLAVLAEKTATPFERAFGTTLAAYEGFLFDEYARCAHIPWIMRVGVYHRVRTRFGFSSVGVPREDEDPYYRRKWRLAFVTYCERHGAPLTGALVRSAGHFPPGRDGTGTVTRDFYDGVPSLRRDSEG